MLRACRQVLRPGGRLAFLTIQPTPGLDPARHQRANQLGPSAVALPTSYPSLLRTAGFVDVRTTDLTAEFGPTLQRWADATDRHEAAIRASIGDETYDERAATRAQSLAAVTEGLLSRFRYTATR